LKPREWQP